MTQASESMQALPADYIDVSEWNGAIQWEALAKRGLKGAMIKSSQGAGEVDSAFKQNMDAALGSGIKVGVYHAFLPNVLPTAQAARFYALIQPYLGKLAWTPALDVERINGRTPKQISDTLYATATKLEVAILNRPMIYTSTGFFDVVEKDGQPVAGVDPEHDAYWSACELWWAFWPPQGSGVRTPKDRLPRPWQNAGKMYTMWQYWNYGHLDAVHSRRVDYDKLPEATP